MFDCAGYVFGSGLVFYIEEKGGLGVRVEAYSYICCFEFGVWQGGAAEEAANNCHLKAGDVVLLRGALLSFRAAFTCKQEHMGVHCNNKQRGLGLAVGLMVTLICLVRIVMNLKVQIQLKETH